MQDAHGVSGLKNTQSQKGLHCWRYFLHTLSIALATDNSSLVADCQSVSAISPGVEVKSNCNSVSIMLQRYPRTSEVCIVSLFNTMDTFLSK